MRGKIRGISALAPTREEVVGKVLDGGGGVAHGLNLDVIAADQLASCPGRAPGLLLRGWFLVSVVLLVHTGQGTGAEEASEEDKVKGTEVETFGHSTLRSSHLVRSRRHENSD